MKEIIFLLIIGLFLFTSHTTQASLIGVKDKLLYPDIMFNVSGILTYDATTDIFKIDALDRFITMPDKTQYPLWYYIPFPTAPLSLITTFYLEALVDESGNLMKFGKVEEKVKEGQVNIFYNNTWYTYGPGTTLLAGTIYAFGWGEGPLLGQFDFLVKDLGGALVDDGIWPKNLPTGIFAMAERLGGWTGSWNESFALEKVKGDKAPVPIPASFILLGSGLLAIVGLGRILRKK